ncbi:AraC family transcriptional regulator [Novosphingobium sp. ZN18A2]|uniref:helix-turn-helix transcriptional regulator n=1 Tax=Novosphingobium sp. ZN18A2 TaxID=3079861 RepID=UPI0030D18210
MDSGSEADGSGTFAKSDGKTQAAHGAVNHALVRRSLIDFQYVAPPAALEPFVLRYVLLRCDEPHIADIQAAGMGLVIAFLRGTGEIHLPGGEIAKSSRINLLTPQTEASPLLIDGPWHAFAATLTPLGWAALSGLSAADHGNRMYDAGAVMGEAFARLGEDLVRRYDRGDASAADLAEIASETLAAAIRPVPEPHVRLIDLTTQWMSESLSPKVEDLADRALYSRRQLQRLIHQYFGLPPKQLARKYRAFRAAALLADPETGPEEIVRIENAFYDQPHMIREIRLFVGRTPSRLGESDTPLLTELLALRHYRETRPRYAGLPPDFERKVPD